MITWRVKWEKRARNSLTVNEQFLERISYWGKNLLLICGSVDGVTVVI